MKKVISLITLFSLVLFTFPVPATYAEEDPGDPYEAILRADKTTEVGGVQVWNDGETLYVQLETEDPWCMTEIHLQVANDVGNVPQTQPNKKGIGGGNPIPGHFAINEKLAECVQNSEVYEWDLSDNGWDETSNLVIAAHAVVEKYENQCHMEQQGTTPETMSVVSDTNTLADGVPAVATWVHPAWTANIPDATWIWNSNPVNLPPTGETVSFTRDFNVDGSVTSASFDIATDNTYSFQINGAAIGSSADLNNFTLATQDNYPDMASYLNSNMGNSIQISVNNPYWNTTNPEVNPAGLLYKLTVNYDKPVEVQVCEDVLVATESAWAGEVDFPGANWARYFTYQMNPGRWELMQTIQVPANNETGAYSGEVVEGAKYLIKVSGAYKFVTWPGFDLVTGEPFGYADAEYSNRIAAYGLNGVAGWTLGEGFFSSVCGLDLQVNECVEWGEFNTEHEYEQVFTAGNSPFHFFIYDNQYSDNVGGLTVDIYEKLY